VSTNAELREEAETLGQELGVSVDTQGKSNAALKRLVEDLYKQLDETESGQSAPVEEPPAADTEPPVPPTQAPAPAVVEQAVTRAPGAPLVYRFTVAPGCALVGPRGVLGPGKEVLMKDVGGNESVMRRHINAGRVLEKK
jgi:hypothetical protein